MAGAVVGLVLLAGCDAGPRAGAPHPGAEPGPSTASDVTTDCLATGSLDTVAGINRFVTGVRGGGAFAGGDVGASVQLQDGRRLFVFGDTLRAPTYQGQQFVRNSMLVFAPGCSRVVLPAADGGAVIPDRPDGVGYWPMSIARIERYGVDLVGVGVQRVRARGKGVFDFEILGPSMALFRVPRGGVPQLVTVRDLGPDHVDPEQPMWGAAAVVRGGWVYLFGTARRRDARIEGFSLRVARVRPASLAHRADWRFWDGARWSRRERTAAVLVPSRGGVSQTLSVFRSGGSWYALSKRDEVLGSDLTLWRAPRITGPYVALPPAAHIPSDAATGTLRYLPLAHPDLLPVPGTVVVSYSENNTDFQQVREDPRRYRPRFLRIRLPR
ncbi:hypothetical protein GCM10022237_22490 [Nocardioides ginsengisoli]